VKGQYRFLLFALLAVFLVVALDRVTIRQPNREHRQASASMAKPEIKESRLKEKVVSQKAWVIPLYPVGDLPVTSPVKAAPKPEQKPQKPLKTAANKKLKSPTQRRIATDRDGQFPVLVVGYEAIGFAGYLDAIERVGHFFLISQTEQGTEIGSEISLRSQTIYRHRIDMGKLAVKRPHLVSDAMIQERLAGFSLPDNVQTDSIILVFSKPFDDLLWETIKGALSKNNLNLEDISRIDGGYVRVRQDVFLLIRTAERKDTGEEIRLNKRLRISLG